MLLRAFVACFILLTGNTFAQEVSNSESGAKVDAQPPEQKPKREVVTTATSSALTAGGGAAIGSIGGLRNPGSTKVSSGGGATHSIPIAVPPGLVKPNLSFNYTSQGTNGLLGVGWSVGGLPVIHRCPRTVAQDGQRGGITYTSSDRFCLDGQRLMVISGTYGASGSEYRTEIDAFLKITAQGAAGSGPAYFIVKTKDGETMEFGGNASSDQGRIEAQGRSEARIWALSKLSDVKGNYLAVSYAEDNTNGEYRPSQIDYSGNSNGGLTPTRSVVFGYDENSVDRTDKIPLWVGGSKILTTKLLTSVKTYAPPSGGGGASLVREYRLEYETSSITQRSRLISLAECDKNGGCLAPYSVSYQNGGNNTLVTTSFDINDNQINTESYLGDFNADGKIDLASWKNGDVYVHLSNGSGQYTPVSTPAPSGSFSVTYTWAGDVNGDGRTDLVSFNNGSLFTRLAKADDSGQFEPRIERTVQSSKFEKEKAWLIDVNGDGRADIVSRANNKFWTYLSDFLGTGGNFLASPAEAPSPDSQFNNTYNWTGDFNGDGFQDIAAYNNGALWAHLSNGTGNSYTAVSTTIPSGQFNNLKAWLGDYNGDGLTDFATFENGLLYTYLAKGDGTFFKDNVSFNPPSASFNSENVWAADINGDGRTDLVSFDTGYFHVYYSRGDATYFLVTSNPPSDTVDTANGNTWPGDASGDGKGDLLSFKNGHLYTHFAHVNSATDRFPDLANSIVNPLGGTNTIAYQPLTDGAPFYLKDTGTLAASYPKVDLQYPTYAVSSLTISDGLGSSYVHTYAYDGAKAHFLGRGGLGFRSMTHVDTDADLRTKTFYKQDFPHVGLVEIVEADRNSDEAAFRETFTQYENLNGYTQAPTISFIGVKEIEIKEYEGSTSQSRSIRRKMFYDSAVNGNLIRTLHEGDLSVSGNGDERDELTDWAVVNTSSVYLHRPKRQVVYNGNSQGGAPILREKWLYYDGMAHGQIGSFGLLTKEELSGGDGQGSGGNNPVTGKNPVTTYTHDPNFGVVTSLRDPRGCETITVYEATKTFPQSITNCLGHEKTLGFDPGLGVKLSETDPNEATTTYEYDGFGRTKKVIGPLASSTHPTISYEYVNWGTIDGSLSSQHIKTSRREEHGQAGTLDSWEYFDGLGRVDFTRQEGPDTSKFIITDTVHNSRNLVIQRSAPYFVDSGNGPLEQIKNVTFTYDVLGRLKRTTNADTTYSENVYKVPGIVETTDERGKMRRKHFDAHGRMVKAEEINSGQTYTTTYAYDGVGSLLTVVNHLGHTTRIAYDKLGRKEAMCDPNMGTASGVTSCTTGSVGAWVYTYNPAGDLKTQKDAKNQTICFDYDDLGRPTVKKHGSTCTGSALITWTYDDSAVQFSKGRVTQILDSATTTKFAYDIEGRTVETERLVLGAPKTISYTYNALNQVRTETFPPEPDNDRTVTYNYNNAGWLLSVHAQTGANYINEILYNARGQKTKLTYGNNLVTDWTFDANRFWVNTRVTSGNQQNLTYTRDEVGNIKTITDAISSTGSRTFTYDDLSRLTTASGNFGPNQALQNCTYEYNAIGNIINKCGTTFSYGDAMHPSAVTHNPATGKSYTYDANGNMLTRGNQTLTWDIDNRVTSVVISGGGTTTMEYDYTGIRFKKNAPAGITMFPFQGYEIAPSGEITKFIKIGVETFASKRGTAKLYYHNDHLGSVHTITRENQTQAQLHEYDPWGGVSKSVGNIDPTHRFNGKELDPESGLYYYGGRYYDPEISRFISPDPFIPKPSNPQSLNRYSYTLNNPQNYIDPSGFFFGKLFKAIGNFFKSIVKNPGVFFASLGVGLVTGAIAGHYGGPIVGGAVGGAAAAMTAAAMTGGNIGEAAITGLIAGAVGGAVFQELGGAAAGFQAGLRAVLGGAIAGGAASGAMNTVFNGGNFAVNVFSGAITSGITAAAAYGAFKGYRWLNEKMTTAIRENQTASFLGERTAYEAPRETMNDAGSIYPRENPSTFYQAFSRGMLRAATLILAAEVMHAGEFMIMGGIAASALGPVGAAIGLPVAALGVGVTAGGAVLGLNALGISEALGVFDLGMFDAPKTHGCTLCVAR